MKNTQLRNTLLLVLCAFIWGTAFVAQSVGGEYLGPNSFLAARSWLAVVFLFVLVSVRNAASRRKGVKAPFLKGGRTLVIGGLLCGAALFAASVTQQMGVVTTGTAKAGFITALYVVLVPVFGIFFGRKPSLKIWCCVAAAVAGLYLLCLAGRGSLSFTGGEWELLLCALLFTIQILLVNRFSPRLDGIQLSFVQFLTVAILSTIFMFVFEAPTPAQFIDGIVAIAYCGLLSSGVAYTLQIIGQKDLDPAIASLAMCLESVFSAIAGWLVLGQVLSAFEISGCALMFAAIAVSQLPERRPRAS